MIDAERDIPLEEADAETDNDDRFRFTEAGARRVLYHDCDEETIVAACTHLRWQRSLWTEPLPIDDWPDVRTTSIVCRGDRIVRPDWFVQVTRERLSIEPILLPGGHSPMLSRPTDLVAKLLVD